MEDSNLIARVYPACHDTKNSWVDIIKSGKLPAALEDEGEHSGFGYRAIELRFDDIPRSHHGRIFGCNPESDLVLPKVSGLSHHHFSLTFDDHRRLIVKDWGSLQGTEVTYGIRGKGKRSGFSWIVSSNPIVQNGIITINVENIKFRIVPVHHDIQSEPYISNVDRFRQGTATAEDLFRHLDLPPGPETKRPTGAHSPGKRPIYLRKRIGQGGFGLVRRHWNVSDATEYASKVPRSFRYMTEQKKEKTMKAWKNEARIMGNLKHVCLPQDSCFSPTDAWQPNIVRLIGSKWDRRPTLLLEYVPGGSLDKYHNLSRVECVSILCQCYSALKYLHSRDPPVVHRDIKLANILVQDRRLGLSIHVKFSDFGLSKDTSDLFSVCGTRPYFPPEMIQRETRRDQSGEKMAYSAAVDIWSLGVVALEMIGGLPEWKESLGGDAWCRKIIQSLKNGLGPQPDELKQFLLEAMVVISPDERGSAEHCHRRALLLLDKAKASPKQVTAATGEASDTPPSASLVPVSRLGQKSPATDSTGGRHSKAARCSGLGEGSNK